MSFTGHCHCGAVQITIAHRPTYINDCNCSLCKRLGALWGYFVPDRVTIKGDTATYTRVDRDVPNIIAHFCDRCGCSTHWIATGLRATERMGVNMHLFEDDAVTGVRLQYLDGASWNQDSWPRKLRADVRLPLPVDAEAGLATFDPLVPDDTA